MLTTRIDLTIVIDVQTHGEEIATAAIAASADRRWPSRERLSGTGGRRASRSGRRVPRSWTFCRICSSLASHTIQWHDMRSADRIASYNRERWDALADADALFGRLYLDLDAATAIEKIDPEHRLGELDGKRVPCLAGGGGRQSVAFAILGASVTVLDVSSRMLQRGRVAAADYQLSIETMQGDMRDLSLFGPASFNIVWQPYSLNFVPDVRAVFRQVARIIRPDSLYYLMVANPFTIGLPTYDWTGTGYLLKEPYIDGAEINHRDEPWVYSREVAGTSIQGPKEFHHALSTVVNGLIERGFVLNHVSEHTHDISDAVPGS